MPSSNPDEAGSQWVADPTPRAWRSRSTVVTILAVSVLVILAAAFYGSAFAPPRHAISLLFGDPNDPGDPYARLPEAQRKEFEARVDAASDGSLAGLSRPAAAAEIQRVIFRGRSRLDDATLVHRIRLLEALIRKADVATCAAMARASYIGKRDADSFGKARGSLDPSEYGQWVEIDVEAYEAEMHAAPPKRATTEASVARLLADLPDGDQETAQALYRGAAVPDIDACEVMRDRYAAALQLDPEDLATFALSGVER